MEILYVLKNFASHGLYGGPNNIKQNKFELYSSFGAKKIILFQKEKIHKKSKLFLDGLS